MDNFCNFPDLVHCCDLLLKCILVVFVHKDSNYHQEPDDLGQS